jgi:hypothetical protein
MGRTDAWSLQLPEPLPVMPEAVENVATQVVNSNAQLAEILNRPAPVQANDQTRAAISSCPSCRASLSGVEQKFERCLSCGKSFAGNASAISVSVGI